MFNKLFTRPNKFKITVEYSDHKATKTRTTSVKVDAPKYIYTIASPGSSEQLRVTIEKEK